MTGSLPGKYGCVRCGHPDNLHGDTEVDSEHDEIEFNDHPCTGDDGDCGCEEFVEAEN